MPRRNAKPKSSPGKVRLAAAHGAGVPDPAAASAEPAAGAAPAGDPPHASAADASKELPALVTASPPVAPRPTARISPAGALPPARIPPESLRAPKGNRLLAIAAAVSIGIHLVALSIHFAPVVLKDLGSGPPLEVALVNAKTKSKPTKADILAQAHLDGGGNTDLDRRAKTPLPVMPKESPPQEIAQSARKVEELEQRTREVMSQLKASVPAPAAAPPAPEAGDRPQDLPNAREAMQRTMEAMRLEAQIAKDIEAYQKRPKRRFVGARAEEYRFARYVEDWRLKIERIGNNNYPEAARREKLYGSLLLTVSIKADGTVEAIEVNRSAGHRILDAAAVKIVEMAAPFAPFPPDIKRDTDILTITRTWSFTKGDELVAQ
jgi:periplasmic protein TonB